MRDLAGLELGPDDFDRLRELCKEDPRFPANLQAWMRLMRIAATDAVNVGSVPTSHKLDTRHFETWCAQVSIAPCVDALRAYAIIQRSAWANHKRKAPG